ncbi:MAG: hypothetical protein JNL58_30080 [Planctomyces sp.]|nr:hypothetical protein [Planctomyces sp.]
MMQPHLQPILRMRQGERILVLVSVVPGGKAEQVFAAMWSYKNELPKVRVIEDRSFVYIDASSLVDPIRYFPSQCKLLSAVFHCLVVVADPTSTSASRDAFLSNFLCGFWLGRTTGEYSRCLHAAYGTVRNRENNNIPTDLTAHMNYFLTGEDFLEICPTWLDREGTGKLKDNWLKKLDATLTPANFQSTHLELIGYSKDLYASDLARDAIASVDAVRKAFDHVGTLSRISQLSSAVFILTLTIHDELFPKLHQILENLLDDRPESQKPFDYTETMGVLSELVWQLGELITYIKRLAAALTVYSRSSRPSFRRITGVELGEFLEHSDKFLTSVSGLTNKAKFAPLTQKKEILRTGVVKLPEERSYVDLKRKYIPDLLKSLAPGLGELHVRVAKLCVPLAEVKCEPASLTHPIRQMLGSLSSSSTNLVNESVNIA